MKISFIIPSRNNKIYLQQAVNSILECYGTEHDLVLLDDASDDGTWEWIQSLEGEHFIKYRNEGPERVGHTILYDKGIELSKTEVFSIFHADMITTKNHIPNLLKHLKPQTVVAATRIEPPLHPPGPEKYVRTYGFEPSEFKKDEFLKELEILEKDNQDKTTQGIFAPWLMFKSDFEAIGGHDPLFAPMELEDSDIFNRMYLAGYELIQSRDSFVYHMTCRGSRFKDGLEIEQEIPLPDGTIWYKPKDSEEYKALRALKFREWWRKWGQNVLHDDLMMPVVNPKYNIAYVVKNCKGNMIEVLEPWCDRIYIENQDIVDIYIDREQPNTQFDLTKRVFTLTNNTPEWENDIVIEFDANQLNQQNFQLLTQMPVIIQESGEIGEFELDIFRVIISHIEEYQNNLIKI